MSLADELTAKYFNPDEVGWATREWVVVAIKEAIERCDARGR